MIIGAAVFAIIAVSIFQSYSSLISLVSLGRWKITAADIANADFEMIRVMPYGDIGLIDGVPDGLLEMTEEVNVGSATFKITRTVRNIDDQFDGLIGQIPNDLSPADYKMVEIYVECPSCRNFTPASIVGYVAPKNLETASGNGALFIRVFDANGVPIQGAHVAVLKSVSPIVSLSDVTDANGLLAIVDAPPANNAYNIVVSKNNYTTDMTHAASAENPNPSKPDATVLEGQVTQVSFIIDKVSAIAVRTKDALCAPIGGVPFTLTGSKLIGTEPDVIKFEESYATDPSGEKNIPDVEWDTFSLTLGPNPYYLAGLNPIGLVSVLPDSLQNIDLILTDELPSHLLVSAKDASTGLPLSEVSLVLTKTDFSLDKITGRGSMEQTDWSGGSGQDNFTDSFKFSSQDGNIEIANPAGEIKLAESLGVYSLSGNLISSVFDTGTSSNWGSVLWSPTAQPPEAGPDSIRFQIATASANDSETIWEFKGPDGTDSSFYSTSNTNINSIHNGDRYFRYKVYLSTIDDAFTPNLANVALTFTSECIPPGQAVFSALPDDTYDLLVQKSSYISQDIQDIIINEDWKLLEVTLMPE